jgi:hypothetical protein
MSSAHILAAAIAWAAPNLPNETVARYAADIDAAIEPEEVATVGFALVASAKWESHFREPIEKCVCARHECDSDKHGRPHAFGLYQLHVEKLGGYSPAEICASNALSSQRAAVTMRDLLKRAAGRWSRVFTFYVGGETPSVLGRRADFDWMRKNRLMLAEKGEALCQGW